MRRRIRTMLGGVAATLLLTTICVTPAHAEPSYNVTGRGIVSWNYSRSLYDNYNSQHIRFGYDGNGMRITRRGAWCGRNIDSKAPTDGLYSQYDYGANWQQLW